MAIVAPLKAAALSDFASIAEAMRRLATVALHGSTFALYLEAEKCLVAALRARVAAIIVRSGGQWRPWHTLSEDCAVVTASLDVPPEAVGWDSERRLASGALFVPVRPGGVAALIDLDDPHVGNAALRDTLAASIDLALTTCERQTVASESVNEIQVLHRVATRILTSRDLEEIQLLITQEAKRLLAADICGILLRENDQVVMRRCVGNLSPETAALRMSQGQGLAGRVFATGEPCCVDDYLESKLISRDFFDLAQVERVRSALGAPLLSSNSVVGVLEVWRRRASIFTDQDKSRLIALAHLTSIAIDNARLYAEQGATVRELARANGELAERFEAIKGLADLQRDLVQLLIDNRNLAAIASRAAEHLGLNVMIVDLDLRVLGACPPVDEVPAHLREPLVNALRAPLSSAAAQKRTSGLHAQRIAIGNEVVGLAAAFGENLDDAGRLAISQVAMAAALFLHEQHAARKARTETLEALLWDLLEGTDAVRHAALDLARRINAEARGPVRVMLCSFTGIENFARAHGWGAGEMDACRRRIREACEQQQDRAGMPRLIGMRANHIVFLLPDKGTDACERTADTLARAIAGEAAGLAIHIGASAPRSDLLSLQKAHSEARISADVAGQHGAVAGAVFERGGVVGVLLGLRQDGNIKALVARTFGGLLDLSDRQRQVLLRTLQVFFDCNCSQQAAARHLRVHYKTISYRLARISQLSGLDLGKREDRLLADLALYVNELIAGKSHIERKDGGAP
ncbi:MAG: helix-turn-helix domain-containing protein [Burkholderiales bacterium]|nr:helix-turn-helix domain-containing protein [Burkholderiales bacterium]